MHARRRLKRFGNAVSIGLFSIYKLRMCHRCQDYSNRWVYLGNWILIAQQWSVNGIQWLHCLLDIEWKLITLCLVYNIV